MKFRLNWWRLLCGSHKKWTVLHAKTMCGVRTACTISSRGMVDSKAYERPPHSANIIYFVFLGQYFCTTQNIYSTDAVGIAQMIRRPCSGTPAPKRVKGVAPLDGGGSSNKSNSNTSITADTERIRVRFTHSLHTIAGKYYRKCLIKINWFMENARLC